MDNPSLSQQPQQQTAPTDELPRLEIEEAIAEAKAEQDKLLSLFPEAERSRRKKKNQREEDAMLADAVESVQRYQKDLKVIEGKIESLKDQRVEKAKASTPDSDRRGEELKLLLVESESSIAEIEAQREKLREDVLIATETYRERKSLFENASPEARLECEVLCKQASESFEASTKALNEYEEAVGAGLDIIKNEKVETLQLEAEFLDQIIKPEITANPFLVFSEGSDPIPYYNALESYLVTNHSNNLARTAIAVLRLGLGGNEEGRDWLKSLAEGELLPVNFPLKDLKQHFFMQFLKESEAKAIVKKFMASTSGTFRGGRAQKYERLKMDYVTIVVLVIEAELPLVEDDTDLCDDLLDALIAAQEKEEEGLNFE